MMSSIDEELIKQCIAGNTSAFNGLVKKYKNAVHAIGFQYFRNVHDAEDIAQETFIRAYCKLEQLKAPAKFGSWLLSIATRCCQTKAREERRHTDSLSLLTDVPTSDMSALAEQADEAIRHRENVWDAIAALPEVYRLPIVWHYIEGYSYREIADFLGISPAAVKGRLQRGRLRLREEVLDVAKEEATMSKKDATFNEKIQQTICQIAKIPIEEKVTAGEAKNIVLYIGLFNAHLTIIGHEDEDVKITGAKFALGYSGEDIEKRLERIELRVDLVTSFFDVGPHEGEFYLGVRSMYDLEPSVTSTQKWWQGIKTGLEQFDGELGQQLQETLSQQATRISVVSRKIEGIRIEQSPDEQIAKAFRSSWGNIYGPAHGIALTIGIPKGCTLSVVATTGNEIEASEVDGNVNILGGRVSSLRNARGGVCLYDALIDEIGNFNGNIMVYSGHSGGGEWTADRAYRFSIQASVYSNISGCLNVAYDNAHLTFRDVSGRVSIKNEYGDTDLRIREWLDGNEWEVKSVSGRVHVRMDEEVADKIRLSASTRCGSISYGAWRPYPNFPHNNTPQSIHLRSVPYDEAVDLALQTQSGDIVLEKVRG